MSISHRSAPYSIHAEPELCHSVISDCLTAHLSLLFPLLPVVWILKQGCAILACVSCLGAGDRCTQRVLTHGHRQIKLGLLKQLLSQLSLGPQPQHRQLNYTEINPQTLPYTLMYGGTKNRPQMTLICGAITCRQPEAASRTVQMFLP